MQEWDLGYKTDRGTSLACTSRPMKGRVTQPWKSLHEVHMLRHRNIVARMGTSIDSQ